MTNQRYDLGMIGLGVMGHNLALNMADHGYSVIGYDKDPAKVAEFRPVEGQNVRAVSDLNEMVSLLAQPRTVMLLVPAGGVVDQVIGELANVLAPGDLIIDAGNSYFRDTDRRCGDLAKRGLMFLGVGVSGGAEGARHGPSIMPGGPREAYERVRAILEAVAAHANGDPCVCYLGKGSAGHYVKMVHNGIEYGLMRLIAETYDLMKRGLGHDNDQLQQTYERWNDGRARSFLVEITAEIFAQTDDRTGRRLIDAILDESGQKGTGAWTSQQAMELQVPAPTIDLAVEMREMSVDKAQRELGSRTFGGPPCAYRGDGRAFVDQLEAALYAGMILTYAQGMALLGRAAEVYGYGYRLEDVARIWRAGCIIRSALLEDLREAFRRRGDLPNLLADESLAQEIRQTAESLRTVTVTAAQAGIPAPGFASCLAYFDSYRSRWLPDNLIQAQRDFFGSHTYQRVDMAGTFHTDWGRGAK